MAFHPLLRDRNDQVFLIHANTDGTRLEAAILVVDGFVADGWLEVSADHSLSSEIYGIQLPAEVIGQPERYKGYDVVLPLKRIV
jgi:hypothetical protein